MAESESKSEFERPKRRTASISEQQSDGREEQLCASISIPAQVRIQFGQRQRQRQNARMARLRPPPGPVLASLGLCCLLTCRLAAYLARAELVPPSSFSFEPDDWATFPSSPLGASRNAGGAAPAQQNPAPTKAPTGHYPITTTTSTTGQPEQRLRPPQQQQHRREHPYPEEQPQPSRRPSSAAAQIEQGASRSPWPERQSDVVKTTMARPNSNRNLIPSSIATPTAELNWSALTGGGLSILPAERGSARNKSGSRKLLTAQKQTTPTTQTSSSSSTNLLSAQRRLQYPASKASTGPYRLPAYFDYRLYKQFHDKHYLSRRADERHKRIYLRTALKVFEQRALYRARRQATLASINELSDLVSVITIAITNTVPAHPSLRWPSRRRLQSWWPIGKMRRA